MYAVLLLDYRVLQLAQSLLLAPADASASVGKVTADSCPITPDVSMVLVLQQLRTMLTLPCRRNAHLQIIYFGREHCPAQRHDHKTCPICSWAADVSSTEAGGRGTGAKNSKAGGDSSSSTPRPGAKRKPAREVATAVAVVADQETNVAVTVVAAGHAVVVDKLKAARRRRL
eukprot:GHUV01041708.1.p1 GENE.GHUV01041708.1~~GHUV01041708.1.p1  ORF type:complete len:172 (-),score=45.06 GHUV01041708.1:160-675(-)